MVETNKRAADTFPRLLLQHAKTRPDRPAFREKDLGIWQTTSWAQAADEVRNAIGSVRHKLPSEIREPVLTRLDPSAQPIVQALREGAQVVVTGRTGDPSLALAPL